MGGPDVFDRTGRRKPTITLEQAKGVRSRQKGVLMFEVSPTSSAGEISAWRNIEH
jgi:hypothetical protein